MVNMERSSKLGTKNVRYIIPSGQVTEAARRFRLDMRAAQLSGRENVVV